MFALVEFIWNSQHVAYICILACFHLRTHMCGCVCVIIPKPALAAAASYNVTPK